MVQQEPEVLLRLIWREIEENNDAIMRGDARCLAEVETKIHVFCENIRRLPPQDAIHFQKDFQALLDRLVFWAEYLEQRKKEIEIELKNLNTQAKAQAAYLSRRSQASPESE